MAVSSRIIRRRLKSVKSTGKIMKAMELVAASKMRKSVQQATSGRPYAQAIEHLVQRVIQTGGETSMAQTLPAHPFLRTSSLEGAVSSRTWLVVFASDRGLCGGFNTQVGRLALEELRHRTSQGEHVDVITVGARIERQIRAAGYTVRAAFPAFSQAPSFERLSALFQYVREGFLRGEVDRVVLTFTHFKSALVQEPRVLQVLPVTAFSDASQHATTATLAFVGDQLIEPSSEAVIAQLLPRFVDTQIYQSALESAASEHSARMLAMRSAGDAAKDMVDALTLSLNQARQAAITREISEISAGKAALTA